MNTNKSQINLVLLHGWAVNHHVFDDFQHDLGDFAHVIAPDLWGHGANTQTEFDLNSALSNLNQAIREPSILMGWSLGGLLSLCLAARYPDKILGVIVSNGFANFAAQGGNVSALVRMADFLKQDYPKYLKQFLEVQLINTPERKPILNQILPDLLQYGAPSGLHSTLSALSDVDVRPILPEIQQPVLLLYGAKDSITPPSMGEYLAENLPNAQIHIHEKAVHAPFLSHPNWCADHIHTWLKTHFSF